MKPGRTRGTPQRPGQLAPGLRRLLPSALRTRLALLFGVAVALVIAFAVAALALGTDRQFDAAVDAGLQARAEALQAAIARQDVAVVRQDQLAQLLGPDGRVVAESSRLDAFGAAAGQGALAPPGALAAARADPGGPVTGDRAVRALGAVRYLVVAVDAPQPGSLLVVASTLEEVQSAEGRLVGLFLAGAPLLVAGLGLAGWVLAGAALRPVADLTRRAARISAADVDQRLPQPPGTDEVAVLARTLNGMLGRVAQGVRREREFVDDAAHELRTPIAVLRGELELALRLGHDLPEDVRESLRSALEEAERLSRLAQDLLVLASQERAARRLEPVALGALVRGEAPRLAAAHGVAVDVDAPGGDGVARGGVVVDGDATGLARLLANLVANSGAAGARRVVVRVRTAAAQGGGGAVLEVADDGPGFPPALLATATERFTRGDDARTRGDAGRGGAGLGLSIAAAVVAAHGGQLELRRDEVLGGALVAVRLPLVSVAHGAPAAAS